MNVTDKQYQKAIIGVYFDENAPQSPIRFDGIGLFVL
jgi:hypothetical protein